MSGALLLTSRYSLRITQWVAVKFAQPQKMLQEPVIMWFDIALWLATFFIFLRISCAVLCPVLYSFLWIKSFAQTVVFWVCSASNLVCVSAEGDSQWTGCCLSSFFIWPKLFCICLVGGEGELYHLALAVWFDRTAILHLSAPRVGLG